MSQAKQPHYPDMWKIQARLTPGKVYRGQRAKLYIYVLGTLPDQPGWVMVRKASSAEITAFERRRRLLKEEGLPVRERPAGPTTVVDLRGVRVFDDYGDGDWD